MPWVIAIKGDVQSNHFLHQQSQVGDAPPKAVELLSQKEVGQLLGMSTRAVRATERRAFQKIRNQIQHVWKLFLAGELEEDQQNLTREEIEALFNVARTLGEHALLQKILTLISPARN
jgi:hypothetical protein